VKLASILVSVLLGVTAVTSIATVSPVAAQPAAAIGRPLPDGNLPTGTISVRVVAGSPSSPVVGADVTMLVNGESRMARTDASGRATFGGLPAGAAVQARITDEDKKDILSEPFPVPDEGGVRVMLSTKPFQGTGGLPPASLGGPATGGGGAMPEARQMSGQPRPERNDPAGTFTVRLTYNNLAMKDGKPADSSPPVGEPVMLVGYRSDDTIQVLTQKTDAGGHAAFTGLDTTGGTSYFALASLPRNGGHDRLISVPTARAWCCRATSATRRRLRSMTSAS
jgi:hypothetical protein